MKNRKEKPERWSRKGKCPSCGVGSGSKHRKECTYDYVLNEALPKALTQEQKIKRLDQIEDEAIGCYLDKTDFDISEWIFDDDKTEWRKLKMEINGECPTCGNVPADCECEKD